MLKPSPVSSTDGDRRTTNSWCTTEFYESKIYFNWQIKNFLLCRNNNGEAVESSTFAAANNKSQWCLDIYPNGSDMESQGYVSLFLILVSSNERNIEANYKFYLYDKDSKTKNELIVNSPRKFSPGRGFGFPRFIKRDYLLDEDEGLLSGSDLNIGCEVYMTESTVVRSGVDDSKSLGFVQSDLSRKLDDLFHSQKYWDFILEVNGRKFKCHKAILATCSPVFSAMFEHEMREKNHNEVFITDVDEETMSVFLEYIYTGKVKNMDKFAPHLLVLSEKYDLPMLKLMCEKHLPSVLSTKMAMNMLLLADRVNAESLKKSAIKYFVRNVRAIKATPQWKNISTQRPDLLKELIEALTTD